jgi:two-component system, NtrC family, nitrogen regulation response regulator NtrX
MRILIVDDERAIRFSLLELLEGGSDRVVEAEHAPAALATLEAEPVDLVISDLSMPVMDGCSSSRRCGSAIPTPSSC